jgi:hypothetical protein
MSNIDTLPADLAAHGIAGVIAEHKDDGRLFVHFAREKNGVPMKMGVTLRADEPVKVSTLAFIFRDWLDQHGLEH